MSDQAIDSLPHLHSQETASGSHLRQLNGRILTFKRHVSSSVVSHPAYRSFLQRYDHDQHRPGKATQTIMDVEINAYHEERKSDCRSSEQDFTRSTVLDGGFAVQDVSTRPF
jgi:hypothetical protein